MKTETKIAALYIPSSVTQPLHIVWFDEDTLTASIVSALGCVGVEVTDLGECDGGYDGCSYALYSPATLLDAPEQARPRNVRAEFLARRPRLFHGDAVLTLTDDLGDPVGLREPAISNVPALQTRIEVALLHHAMESLVNGEAPSASRPLYSE